MQTKVEKPQIVEFQPSYQAQIEALVVPIQQDEFGVKITREEQPDLLDIAATFQRGRGNFWVATEKGEVLGTIGVVDIGDAGVALKKMFVRKDARGKESGLAAALMQQAKSWCQARGVRSIYLGTTAQMTAAHRFYEKNGFVEIDRQALPATFPLVHVDTKFYRLNLSD